MLINRPLMQLCVLFIFGILSGSLYHLPAKYMLVLPACFFIAGVLCYIVRLEYTRWFIALFCFSFGVFNAAMASELSSTSLVNYVDKPVTITGTVVKEPDMRHKKVFYVVQVSQLNIRHQTTTINGLVRLTSYNTKKVFSYGDIIRVRGKLEVVKTPGNPGQFDYRRYLERRGIHVIMTVWQDDGIMKVGTNSGGFTGIALVAKHKLQTVLQKTLSPEQTALVNGMLFGSRGMIGSETSEEFQIASLVHVLCVSGFHVGLVLAAFIVLFQMLRLPNKWEAPLGTLVLAVYAVMTGMGPAVMRASVMGLVALWARRMGREKDWPTAMAVAAATILFIWPNALWEPGFQLSFVVTWGLLTMTPHLVKLLTPLPKAIQLLVAVPLVAEITAAPLVIYHYNMVSMVGVVANILSAPLISLVMLLSGISVLVGLLIPFVAYVINATTGVLLDFWLWLVHVLAGMPHAALFLPSPPLWVLVVFYSSLGLFVYKPDLLANKLRSRRLVGILIIILVTVSWVSLSPDKILNVHFIDVGQGDAALVETPDGKHMLIDAGGWRNEFESNSGAGNKVVLPYLKSLGVNSLDVLMLSHPHEDHAGGAGGIIKQIPVKLVITAPLENYTAGDQEMPEPEYMQLLSSLRDKGVLVQQAERGDMLQLEDGVSIKVLAPGGVKKDLNNNSLVVKLTYGDCSILLTGDIEKKQQLYLARNVNGLEADVIKIPHHGSKFFSPEFFRMVDPKLAVISVGENNFGQPASSVLKVLKDMEASIYRTDINGAVIVSTNGRDLWVRTGRGN